MAGVSEGEGNANLSSVLEKLHLGHLENFQPDKVTVDQICKLSYKQMECLGVNDQKTMMTLTLKCLTLEKNPPPRKPGVRFSKARKLFGPRSYFLNSVSNEWR